MVNNYPEYAAGVNFKKTDSNGVRHFYSAQVVADPANETVESKLIKDGVVISEGGGSSDFSTARITVTMTENSTDNFGAMNVIVIGEGPGEISDLTISSAGVRDIVLYKGLFELSTNTDTFVSVSGDATYEIDEEFGDVVITVTGDCSITLNPQHLG